MRPLKAFRKLLFILAVVVACGVVVVALPDNAYQRWQLLDGTIYDRARWIYERCWFDRTPIDIVLIGSSRLAAGVSAPRLSARMQADALPAHVVNFSLPESGRNLNWMIVKDLFKTKQPKLLILGLTEKPSRFGHPAFKTIAAPGDILFPGYLTDLNYFSDLIYLPFRQLRLFAASWLPDSLGLAERFDPARYGGESLETTGSIVLPDGRLKNGETPASAAELARGVQKFVGGSHPALLPEPLADLEFGDERHYVRAIAALAREHGAKIAFLYVPYYGGPERLEDVQGLAFYRQFGPVLNAGFLSSHADWYADYGHVTRSGAERLTDWLAARMAALLAGSTPEAN